MKSLDFNFPASRAGTTYILLTNTCYKEPFDDNRSIVSTMDYTWRPRLSIGVEEPVPGFEALL